jgi:hypothetical protein
MNTINFLNWRNGFYNLKLGDNVKITRPETFPKTLGKKGRTDISFYDYDMNISLLYLILF